MKDNDVNQILIFGLPNVQNLLTEIGRNGDFVPLCVGGIEKQQR